MKIAIIGGGINGIMTALELCKKNHEVTLFEKTTIMSQTSSASSKLLHGGLRYLENLEFRLVKEALGERFFWVNEAPQYVKPIKIFIPIYKYSRRPAWLYKIGLCIYDLLSGKRNLGKHKSYSKTVMKNLCPELKTDGIIKGFSYFDAQMDDYKLGTWVASKLGHYKKFTLRENTSIDTISESGEITHQESKEKFEKIINVTGPWAHELLKANNINTNHELDLIRGSHIIVNRQLNCGYFLEVPNERRVFFVLPYKNKTLIGTTEKRQSLNETIKPSHEEIISLINSYNHYFNKEIKLSDVWQSLAGISPLIKSSKEANKATREYAIQTNKNLITVYGGKWTTSRQLAIKISNLFKS